LDVGGWDFECGRDLCRLYSGVLDYVFGDLLPLDALFDALATVECGERA
jgi:hypothetical protein